MNVAIIGARGIGRVHAGVFHRLGHEVSHVLGTSLESSQRSSRAIAEITGTSPEPCRDLGDLLDRGPEAVVIATPPRVHLPQILAAAAKSIPILCEKPLLWADGFTFRDAMARLSEVRQAAAGLLFVASPNVFLADAIVTRAPLRSEIGRIRFSFHTAGPYTDSEIGVDLLTHAFTIVDSLLGHVSPAHTVTSITANAFHCRLDIAGVSVEFDLREGPHMTKLFEIEVNDRVFRRLQRGTGASYRVAMLDVARGEELVVEDPFVTSARTFIDLVQEDPSGFRSAFERSAAVFESMARVLADSH